MEGLIYRGAVVVVAGGNGNYEAAGYEASACYASSPTSAFGVIVAGASDALGAPAPWSWNASCVTAYAPGVGVGGRSGSSPSTALVAGATALLLSAVPCYTQADAKALLGAPGVLDLRRLAEARNGFAC